MLDKEELDAVYVGTTERARARVRCMRVQSRVHDVYAEKPFTLSDRRGQVLVRAARRAPSAR